jgi:hypothetical protein
MTDSRTARNQAVVALLYQCRRKLEAYHTVTGGQYVNGVEYSTLVAEINSMVNILGDQEDEGTYGQT